MAALNFRRSVGLSIYVKDRIEIDVLQLLSGGKPVTGRPALVATSLLTEDSHEIEISDVEVFSKVCEGDWSEATTLTETANVKVDRLLRLAEWGLLVCDSSNIELAGLKSRDDRLRDVSWNKYAQLSHFMTKWSDDFLSESPIDWRNRNMPTTFTEFEERFGPAPPPMLDYPDAAKKIHLPIIRKKQSLFRILEKRRTTRSYNRRRKMTLSDLAVVLYYCFGCHGFKKMSETLTVLKKTSPSGGALHPIEVYPLVTRVEELDAGTYHYDVSKHSLDLLERQSANDAQAAAMKLVAGQEGLAGAHVIFVLVARFDRYFWKYQGHSKSYKSIAMDAAHLSQTLFLVCTQLGLGAFVTGAINDKFSETLFDLDGVNHGVMAVCGCGVPNARDANQFDYVPFVPGKTKFTD